MKKKIKGIKRGLAVVMAAALLITGLPDADLTASAAATTEGVGVISTVDDPQTLTRPTDTYGNSTINAGKILVGKSVTDGVNDTTGGAEALDLTAELGNMPASTGKTFLPAEDNFLVTVSQTAQMYGVSSRMPVPLDVVFVLDTSGSMGAVDPGSSVNRAHDAVAAINDTIEELMALNAYNRVSVVAFSGHNSDWANDGATTADNDAANVLSELKHYSGAAASSHLTWNDVYLLGRSTVNGTRASRNGHSGGTNIQAGIALGAQQLLNVADTTVEIDGKEYTRMPFIILVSDGAPIMSSPDNEWWNPHMINYQNGLLDDYGDYSYAGNGFLSVLTASYYKEQISKKYYPDGEDAATFYTIGLGLDTENRDDEESESKLSRMTLNPVVEFYNSENEFYDEFQSYWNSYRTEQAFRIRVGKEKGAGGYYHDGYYYFYPEDTTEGVRNDYQTFRNATSGNDIQEWVEVPDGSLMKDNILEDEVTSILYNDAYYDVETSGQMAAVFRELVIEIQKRAITDPTKVDVAWGGGFSGYVNFTDIIGEYMEVKDIKGITNDGYLYQGKSFAQLAENYRSNWESISTTTAAQAAFNAALEESIVTRMNIADDDSVKVSVADVRRLMDKVVAPYSAANPYGGQIYYNSDNDYSNSFVWFGKIHYPEGSNNTIEEDYQIEFVQLAPKDADTVSWISDEENAQTIANAATEAACGAGEELCIVRSYYVYGAAGGVNPAATGEYLNFSLRTIRTLDDPYKHYVSISAPADLLSVQHVLIDDTDPANPVAHYDDLIPTRVVYEVGLQEGITPDNVWQVVNQDYLKEYGNVNEDGSVNFYTNDYRRYDNAEDAAGHTGAVHDHALTYVTFDVSDSNSFYRYEKDTLLVDAQGRPVTGNLTAGAKYYYERTYYTWDPSKPVDGRVQDGIAPANKTAAYIEITMPEDLAVGSIYKDAATGYWYIKEGTYTAFTLTGGDDILKTDNETGTAHIVSHPERTGAATNSHYTTWLGNNGKLTYMGVPAKTVMKDDPNTQAVETANIDGELVKVGETLTYQIRVTNSYDEEVTVNIADKIPAGTELVEGSIKSGVLAANGNITWAINPEGTYANGTIAWEIKDVTPGTTVVVSFDVLVVEGAVKIGKLTNAADIEMPEVNNQYTTNMTTNPVTGKAALDMDGNNLPEDGVAVGDVIQFDIAYFNDTEETATVKVTDNIPVGTEYVNGSASHDPKTIRKDNNNVVTGLEWEFVNIAPGTGGVVSFEVKVNASVQDSGFDADTAPDVINTATITIDNDPDVVIETNTTHTPVKTGDLKLSKVVKDTVTTAGDYTFNFKLTESTGKLSGTYTLTMEGAAAQGNTQSVTFANGTATVAIKAGQTITVKDLPAGVTITVTEPVPGTGFTAEISDNGIVTIPADAAAPVAVTVTNTYKAGAAELIIGGTKSFKNNGLYENTQKFYFELKEVTDGISSQAADLAADVELTANAGASVDGTFQFAKITYDTAGTHYYQLAEINSGFGGVKYDTTVHELKVEVTDDGSGKLQVAVYVKDNAAPTADAWNLIAVNEATNTVDFGALEFSNSYAPLRETLSLVGKKTLNNGVLTNNQFSFLVKEGNDTVATGQSKADGSIVFTTITYTEAGTHIYTVEEVTGAPNMLYGNEKYYIKVEVVEDTVNAVLTKSVYTRRSENESWVVADLNSLTAKDSTPLIFTNTYTPDDVTVTLKGTKTLVGRDMAAGEFDFIVTDVNGAEVVAGSNEAAENNAAGTITFQPISYNLDDLGNDKTETFTYTISEVNEGKDGIGYSTDTYSVTVTVTYNDSTGWSTNVVYPQGTPDTGVNFTNTFTPPGIPVQVEATITTQKTITSVSGGDIPTNLTFGFVAVKAADAIGADGQTIINDGYAVGDIVGTGISAQPSADNNGNVVVGIDFTEMNFYKAGTYQCLLLETNAGQELHGVKYSDAAYLMVITVTQDADSGLLSASTAYYPLTLKAGASVGSTNLADYDVSNTKAEAVNYANEYYADGTLVITAKKVVTGRNQADSARSYDFTLTEQNSVSGGDAVHTGTNDAEGNIVFDTLTFVYDNTFVNDTKTLTYIMEEVPGQLPGIEYDKTKYEIEVVLTHHDTGEQRGTITASHKVIAKYVYDTNASSWTREAYGGDLIFTNTGTIYQGTSTTVDITKKLTGRDMDAGEFGFAMTYVGKMVADQFVADTHAVEDTTLAVAAADGAEQTITLDVSFSKEDAPGTYVFHITEMNNHLGGVTYDQSVYEVQITVEDTNNDGTLNITGKTITQIKDKDGNEVLQALSADAKPAFVNTYAPTSVDVILKGHKTLDGRTLKADEFDFEIYEIRRTIGGATVENRVLKETGANAADGSITFTPITIDEAGTYVYEVVELTTNLPPGVTAGNEKYLVEITVTDNQEGGLVPAIKVEANGNILVPYDESKVGADAQLHFTNTYDAQDVTINLSGTKTLTGRDMTAGEFTFHVYLTSYAENSQATPVTYQDKEVVVGRNQAAADGSAATIDFGEIPFTKAGIYTYQIVEADTDAKNVTKDASVYQVVVTVTDNAATGKLEAKITSMEKDGEAVETIAFTNKYIPTPVTTTIQAAKNLTGKPWNGELFTFKLAENNEPALSGDSVDGFLTAQNDQNGNIVFELTFTEKGTYEYKMTEVVEDIANMKYDTSIREISVTVSDDGNGTLTADVTYADGSPVFNNEYTPSDYFVQLETALDISKELMGRPMQNEEFSFIVKDIQGNDVAKGLNRPDGSVVFDYDLATEVIDGPGILFRRAGIYRYSISEVAGNGNAMAYDPAVWYVQFEVEQDAASGELYLKDNHGTIVEVRNSTADPAEGKVVFTNIYDSADAKVTLTGQKVMTGARTDVKEGEFVFHLLDTNGQIAARGTTDAAGKIVFEEMTFDQVGEYHYTLVEVTGSAKGIEYNINNNSYDVTIDVAEKRLEGSIYMGELVAHVFIDGEYYDPALTGGDAQIVFTNRYTPEAVGVSVYAGKTLKGRELTNEEFTFQLVDETGKVVAEAKNDAYGDVSFPAIRFTKAGKVTYTIREQKGTDSNITYDEAAYTVTIEVTDNQVGQLTAEVTYGTTNGSVPVFKNTYTKPQKPQDPISPGDPGEPEPEDYDAVYVTFEGTKNLKGGTMKDGQFKFVVHDERGLEIGFGTSKADGTIVFDQIPVSSVGTHLWTIEEVNDGQAGITYDTDKIPVVVESEDVNGELKLTVTYPKGKIAFTNVIGSGTPLTGDDAPIGLIFGLLAVVAAGLAGMIVWKKKNEKVTKE